MAFRTRKPSEDVKKYDPALGALRNQVGKKSNSAIGRAAIAEESCVQLEAAHSKWRDALVNEWNDLSNPAVSAHIFCHIECAWGLPCPLIDTGRTRDAVVVIEVCWNSFAEESKEIVAQSRTCVYKDSLDPVWQETLQLQVPKELNTRHAGWILHVCAEVWDTQDGQQTDLLGSVRMPLSKIIAGEMCSVRGCELAMGDSDPFGPSLFWSCSYWPGPLTNPLTTTYELASASAMATETIGISAAHAVTEMLGSLANEGRLICDKPLESDGDLMQSVAREEVWYGVTGISSFDDRYFLAVSEEAGKGTDVLGHLEDAPKAAREELFDETPFDVAPGVLKDISDSVPPDAEDISEEMQPTSQTEEELDKRIREREAQEHRERIQRLAEQSKSYGRSGHRERLRKRKEDKQERHFKLLSDRIEANTAPMARTALGVTYVTASATGYALNEGVSASEILSQTTFNVAYKDGDSSRFLDDVSRASASTPRKDDFLSSVPKRLSSRALAQELSQTQLDVRIRRPKSTGSVAQRSRNLVRGAPTSTVNMIDGIQHAASSIYSTTLASLHGEDLGEPLLGQLPQAQQYFSKGLVARAALQPWNRPDDETFHEASY